MPTAFGGPTPGEFQAERQKASMLGSQQVQQRQAQAQQQNQARATALRQNMKDINALGPQRQAGGPPQSRRSGGGWTTAPHWLEQLNYGVEKFNTARHSRKTKAAKSGILASIQDGTFDPNSAQLLLASEDEGLRALGKTMMESQKDVRDREREVTDLAEERTYKEGVTQAGYTHDLKVAETERSYDLEDTRLERIQEEADYDRDVEQKATELADKQSYDERIYAQRLQAEEDSVKVAERRADFEAAAENADADAVLRSLLEDPEVAGSIGLFDRAIDLTYGRAMNTESAALGDTLQGVVSAQVALKVKQLPGALSEKELAFLKEQMPSAWKDTNAWQKWYNDVYAPTINAAIKKYALEHQYVRDRNGEYVYDDPKTKKIRQPTPGYVEINSIDPIDITGEISGTGGGGGYGARAKGQPYKDEETGKWYEG